MTIQGAIAELKNLLEDDDIPFYYKAAIKKVIETIQMEMVDSKTEPQTECNKLINEVVKLDMSREDKFKVIELLEGHCEKCKHYLFTDIDGYYCEHETYGQPCQYAPKDEPQTCSVNGRPYDCGNCKYHKCTADEPRIDCPWQEGGDDD